MKKPPQRVYFSGTDYTIEQNTELVPNDNKFYIVCKEAIIGNGFRTLQQARQAIAPFLEQAGWKPPTQTKAKTPEQILREERNWTEVYRSDMFVAESHGHSKGGKLRNR